MSLKNNIVRIFSANFLNAISGILIGFIVPAVLSLDSYAYVKTYALYISYIGFLHFGFVDGMYIKYGGKDIEEIDKGILKYEHNIFMFIQIIITVIFIVISIISKNLIVSLMALSIIPINTVSFHKLFFQSTGQFKSFANINYIYTSIYLITNLILVFLIKTDNYILYIMTTMVANIIVFINLEYKFIMRYKNIKTKRTPEVKDNIKVGFYILIANLSVLLFYGIDRWFVKVFYKTNDFAYYSFAISMLNIVNIFISAISITFYNYLSKGEDKERIKELKIYFLIIGGIASFAYFGLACIVNIFLKKYIPSLSIIAISFATYPYMIIINALYVNLYKARKDEKRYLNTVVGILGISIIYNLLAICFFKDVRWIAIATTLSFITWYIYSIKDFKYLKSNFKEIIYLSILLLTFLISSHIENYVIGAILYIGIYLLLVLCLYKRYALELCKIVLIKPNLKI